MNSLRPGGYGLGSIASGGVQPEPGLSVLSTAAGIKASRRGYSPLRDDDAASRRGYSLVEDDVAACINRVIPDITNERPSSVKNLNGPSAVDGQSNLLFVDGLPTDYTRRKVT
ncbi:hypothetical protein SLE2022_008170 [Rubroshorea leprosula]